MIDPLEKLTQKHSLKNKKIGVTKKGNYSTSEGELTTRETISSREPPSDNRKIPISINRYPDTERTVEYEKTELQITDNDEVRFYIFINP